MAGANRSGLVRHHRIRPFVLAAIPAANRAAAAPSTAPFAPPATSCSAPSESPPPGSFPSTSFSPNGRASLTCRRPASSAAIVERSAATSTLDIALNAAYGLTPEEVRLMWDTAPPRMPFRP